MDILAALFSRHRPFKRRLRLFYGRFDGVFLRDFLDGFATSMASTVNSFWYIIFSDWLQHSGHVKAGFDTLKPFLQESHFIPSRQADTVSFTFEKGVSFETAANVSLRVSGATWLNGLSETFTDFTV